MRTLEDEAAAPAPLEVQIWDHWLQQARDGLVHLAVKLLGDGASSNAVLIDTQYQPSLPKPRFVITGVTLVSLDWLASHHPHIHEAINSWMGEQEQQQQHGGGGKPTLAVLVITSDLGRPSSSTAPQGQGARTAAPSGPVDFIMRVATYQLSAATLAKLLDDPTSVEHWVRVVNNLS